MEIRKLAKSKAGRDKQHIYAVVKEEEAAVYVADGNHKTLDRPKRKNRKHIQMIEALPKDVKDVLSSEKVGDLEIKRACKLYKQFVSQGNRDTMKEE